jgi:hypothetical protein
MIGKDIMIYNSVGPKHDWYNKWKNLLSKALFAKESGRSRELTVGMKRLTETGRPTPGHKDLATSCMKDHQNIQWINKDYSSLIFCCKWLTERSAYFVLNPLSQTLCGQISVDHNYQFLDPEATAFLSWKEQKTVKIIHWIFSEWVLLVPIKLIT